MSLTRIAVALLLPLSVAAAALAAPEGPAPAKPAPAVEAVLPTDLVSAQRGNVGILLVAPHGGTAAIEGAPERKSGVRVRDQDTSEIAWIAATRLTGLLGAKPYVVVAQFHRKYADVNRSPEEGVESEAARVHYDAFHRAVRAYVDEIRARFGRGILIDVHLQGRVPDAIVRGTRNGKTVSALLARHGVAALVGDDGLFGLLAKEQYAIIPALDTSGAPADLGKETFFDGGYDVAHYGSHNADGIDAIQVEIGTRLAGARLVSTARDLATALATFHRAHVAARSEPR